MTDRGNVPKMYSVNELYSDSVPPNCCCGCSVQTGTKAIAIFSLVMDVLAIALLIGILVYSLVKGTDGLPSGFEAIVIGLVVFWLLLSFVDMGFNIFLLKGAIQPNLKYCRNWVTYTKVLTVIHIGLAVLTLLKLNIFGGVAQLVAIGKYPYCIFVVNSFVMDVECNPSRYAKSGQDA